MEVIFLEYIYIFFIVKFILCRINFGLLFCFFGLVIFWVGGFKLYVFGFCFLRKCFFWFCIFFRLFFLLVFCFYVKVVFVKSKIVFGFFGWVT